MSGKRPSSENVVKGEYFHAGAARNRRRALWPGRGTRLLRWTPRVAWAVWVGVFRALNRGIRGADSNRSKARNIPSRGWSAGNRCMSDGNLSHAAPHKSIVIIEPWAQPVGPCPVGDDLPRTVPLCRWMRVTTPGIAPGGKALHRGSEDE